jgi:hypothetical protein
VYGGVLTIISFMIIFGWLYSTLFKVYQGKFGMIEQQVLWTSSSATQIEQSDLIIGAKIQTYSNKTVLKKKLTDYISVIYAQVNYNDSAVSPPVYYNSTACTEELTELDGYLCPDLPLY